ncbi:MAG: hypothetical protein OQL06_09490 [Gammaproteobacteria bacterium]|nr:hypothetical protein [Gammaproteobacteria bacterium]
MKLSILIIQIVFTLLMVFVFPIYFSYSTEYPVTPAADSSAPSSILHAPVTEQEDGK